VSAPLALLGVTLTGASYLSVTNGQVEPFDRSLTRTLTKKGSSYDRLIAIASDLGSVYAIVGATAVLAATKRPRLSRDVLLAGLTAWGLAQSIKPLVERQRPYTDEEALRLVAVPAGSSWPSGHTAVATAIACAVAPHVSGRAKLGLSLYAAGVGLSRIRVGVHYASDILAGAGVGLVAAWLTRRGVTTR
jgi:membrane-associated phospholipid phosphatase